MRIKIDENARFVINHCGVDEQLVERELISRLIVSDYLIDSEDWYGARISEVFSNNEPEDEGAIYCVIAEVLGADALKVSVMDALKKCVIMGEGDCEDCGGEMDIDPDETEWHYEHEDGYPKYVVTSETYVCPICGKRIVRKG